MRDSPSQQAACPSWPRAGLSIRQQQIRPGGWGVGRHWGASTKLGVSGPTSLSIHPCPPWCQTPRMCLSLILRTTPKAGKKLDNSPKVTQPENGREPGVEARSVRLQKVLWTHGIQRCGPHTPGAYRSMEERVRAMPGRAWEIPVKGWGPGGCGIQRGEAFWKAEVNREPGSACAWSRGAPHCCRLPLQAAGARDGRESVSFENTDLTNINSSPVLRPLLKVHLASRKGKGRSQHHLQAPDIVWQPETFNPETFHV